MHYPVAIALTTTAAALLTTRAARADDAPDFTWAPGESRTRDTPLAAGPFTGELRLDAAYHYSFARPADDTISGSSEVFRHAELQLTQLGVGGEVNHRGVSARVMTQFGLYATGTPRNDASPARGQWRLDDAYRYLSEAYGGYRIPVLGGITVQAGIFMSYIGLWSYYQANNWTYQPSYVSSNTPWYFNGVRAQWYPTPRLKIEPWIVNGWQSYGRFNTAPGLGVQVVYRPHDALSLVTNQYVGRDTPGNPDRVRIHADNSAMVRLYQRPGAAGLSKLAASLTVDAGCESGGGVRCGDHYFLGAMAYARAWFAADRLAVTAGGGAITNPGRYLVLLPPINGATAASGTPYFTANPGDPYTAWDLQLTGDYLPDPHVTFRLEFNHRAASVPYFTGRGGVTPTGGNQGAPGSAVDGFTPDLDETENRLTAALLIKL